jgi:hypothetical protein
MASFDFTEAELLSLYRDLKEALRRNSEQIGKLGELLVFFLRPSRFFISVQRPKGPGSLYEYPVYRFHLRSSKKGRVLSLRVGLVLTRKRAAHFRQGEWWRDHKSLILVFNRWMAALKRERSDLIKHLGTLRREVRLGRQSVVARFPASHQASLYAQREIAAILDRAAKPVEAARPGGLP